MGKVPVIPAQAGIQRVKRLTKNWTPAFAGVTRAALVVVAAVAIVACLGALAGSGAKAGMPGNLGDGIPHAPLATKVLIWKDCQEIAQCSGCRPVYKCRSCTYQKQCAQRLCQWADVCVWSPSMKLLPRGARIIR